MNMAPITVSMALDDASRQALENLAKALTGNAPEQEPITEVATRVLKSETTQKYTLGLAYPADRADAGIAADGYRDFMAAEQLEKSAWAFMKNRNVGLDHVDGTDGSGTVVESYIYRGPDWTVPTMTGDVVIKAGDWLLGTVWSEQAWESIQKGHRNGLSPQGNARRSTPTPEKLASLRP